MKLSVIIVNFNGRGFIGQCIDSLLSSNYKNLEIIVVDNASTDGSPAFLKKKYAQIKKVKILRSPRQLYFTGGSNLGAEKARGDLLFFLNNDTIIEKNCLKNLLNFYQTHSPRALIQPKILFYPEKKIIDNVGGRYLLGFGFAVGRGEKDNGQYNHNRQYDYVNGTAFLINKKFFWQLRGFDEQFKYLYEDVDLCLRARDAGGECWLCWQAIVYHKGSLTFKKELTPKEIKKQIRHNRLLLIRKRVNQWIKRSINKLRLWELKRIIKKRQFSLLDIGCGDGDFALLAAKRGIKVLAIDKNLHLIPPLYQKEKNLRFKKISLENFTSAEKFEVVTMFHVLEHLEQPAKALKKLGQLLAKGGVLVLEVPLVGNWTEKFLGKDYFAYQDKTHLRFLRKEELKDFLTLAGFKVIKKGFTLYEFPFTLLTRSFRKSISSGLIGLALFFPFKIGALLGANEEILRIYCQKTTNE